MFDRRLLSNFDWTLLLLAVGLSLLGVLSIYSASKGYPGNPQYWLRQLYWIAIGLGLGALTLLVDFRAIGTWSYVFHGGVVASLVVLLLAGSGRGQVDRWFQMGPVAIQPSEFAKFTTILAIAYYLRDGRRIGNLGLRGLIVPTLLMAVPFALIVNQPDLGTALLLPAIFIPLIVQAGLRWKLLLTASVMVLLSIVALILSFQMGYYQVDKKLVANLKRQGYSGEQLAAVGRLEGQRYYYFDPMRGKLLTNPELFGEEKLIQEVEEQSFRPYISAVLRPYQQRRLVTFLNPEQDPLGDGYHVIQSRVAVGSGGFTGKGFGSSTQGSLNFLPARHTDFIFSIFAEEWGFLGVMVLFSLYGILIYRSISIVFQTHDRFSAFVAVGIVSIISFQLLINTGMAVGLLPVVGVPLPFFSYGGSSMITMMTGIAILLNIRMRRFLWG
jgi:rod shape determining protein RodA